MQDYLKSWTLLFIGSMLELLKTITLETLVSCIQFVAFALTIAYTLWKWRAAIRQRNKELFKEKENQNENQNENNS